MQGDQVVRRYIGETAGKIKLRICEAMLGVLFVDEAYHLFSRSENDYGKETANTLMEAFGGDGKIS